jgi:hypothetical protein
MDALFDSCYRSIGDSMTLFEFYRVTCVVVAAIEDGHADCTPPDRPLDDLLKHTKMFPWRLWFNDDKAFVFCEKPGFPTGTEIVSIDDHPMTEIIRRVFDCLKSDGAIRTGKLQPATAPFLGKVYFLINGNSFSATAEFCAVARSERRGEFIGEETGGGYYGNTSGYDTLLVLPNTRIKVDIPRIKYTVAVRPAQYPDRGIIPEHVVIPSIADVMAHKDVALEYALHLATAD